MILQASSPTEEDLKKLIEEFYYLKPGTCILKPISKQRYSVHERRDDGSGRPIKYALAEVKQRRWRFGFEYEEHAQNS
jgi:hypothetical protein